MPTDKGLPSHQDNQKEYAQRNPSPKKGWLSKAFGLAASAAAGMSIGLAAKTCATALLCTAGAPAAVTAVAAMAGAGLVVGAARSYWDYHQDKKNNDQARFWTRGTAVKMGISSGLSIAFGSLFLFAGDEIAEQTGNIWDKLFGSAADNTAAPSGEDLAHKDAVIPPQSATGDNALAAAPSEDTSAAEDHRTAGNNTATDTPPANAAADNNAATSSGPAESAETAPAAPETDADMAAQPPAPAAPPVAAPVPSPAPEPVIYTVECGDNLWNIVKDHYDLTSDADIQRFVDAVAVENGLTEGTSANCIYVGDELTLPDATTIADHTTLVLDWQALDAATKLGAELAEAASAPSAYEAPLPANDPADFVKVADCDVTITSDQGTFDLSCDYQSYEGLGAAYASVSMPDGGMNLNVPLDSETPIREAIVNDVLSAVSREMGNYNGFTPR